MLVDAAKHGDVEIPVFCYEPKLGEPVGACRMCMVEIEGMPKLQTACSTPVRDGMVVYTRNEQVKGAQNAVVEFLLVNHPLDCPVCDKGGECPLQDISMGWGHGRSRFTEAKRHFEKPIPLSPLIGIDRERCILCYRCVRFSQEVAEDSQLQLLERGDKSYVGTFDERPYIAPFHGNITELCPVGALTSYTYRFRARPWDIEQAGSVCTLCPSQCNVSFTVRDEAVKRVLARDNPDVDDGWLCDKGRYGFEMLAGEARVRGPALRSGGNPAGASWPEAIERAAAGLRAGGARTAAIVGDASNEEGHLVQRILRGALGSAHVDSRPAGGPEREELVKLADPAISARVPDIDAAGAILVIGTDPLHSSPILDLRIRKAVRRNGARLAVATERPTALDGGAAAVARYAPGAAAGFLAELCAALAGSGEASGPAAEVAGALSGAEEVVVVWGERIGRGESGPTAIEGLLGLAEGLGMSGKEGSGLLEVPDLTNARGLREVGCLPGRRSGFDRSRGRDGDGGDPRRPGVGIPLRGGPLRHRPGARPARRRRLEASAVRRRSRDRLLDARERDDRSRRRRLPAREPRREGRDRHASRRAPAAGAAERLPAWGRAARVAGAGRAVRGTRATRPGSSRLPTRLRLSLSRFRSTQGSPMLRSEAAVFGGRIGRRPPADPPGEQLRARHRISTQWDRRAPC